MKNRQQEENNDSEKTKESLQGYARYSNMAIQMFAIIGIGVFGGYKLDGLTGIRFPVFTVVLSILAVFGAIYLSVKDLLRTKKK